MLFGGYEADPVSRWEDGVPWEHGSRSLPPDEERFRPLWQGAIRRFPFLNDAGMVKLVCHPDAMTPDGNPLLGPMPGVPGFWMAAGLSLNGFGGAGGMGKTAAELITSGESELDVQGYRPWRFGGALPRPRLRDRRRARGLPLLLPPSLSARHGRVGEAAAAQPAARAPAGAGRGLRDEERLGAGRLLPSRARPGGARAPTSASSAGRLRRISTSSRRSTARSASASGSST